MTLPMEKTSIHDGRFDLLWGREKDSLLYGRHSGAVESKPEASASYFNMGNDCKSKNRSEEAIAWYQRAVSVRPAFAEAYNNMGLVFQENGLLDASIRCFQKAIESDPNLFQAYYNLGVSFASRQDVDGAVLAFQQALALQPDLSMAYNRLGAIFREQGRLDQAISCFRREIEIDPGNAQAYNNLGSTLHDMGDVDEAIRCYQKSLHLRPDHVETRWNLALAQLLTGNYLEGWSGYECRFGRKSHKPSSLEITGVPQWDGSSFVGKRLLVQEEQGLGDNLQFVRYLPMVKERGGTVILMIDKPLVDLFSGLNGVDKMAECSSNEARDVNVDFHIPLMSLPRLFRTTLDTVPAHVPYLGAEGQRVQSWHERLKAFPGLKVGICWQGNPSFKGDRFRSIPLKAFFGLAGLKGVQLISLQKHHGVDQLSDLPGHVSIADFGRFLDESTGAFVDTAALMKNLDLVISSDTAIAHLAGALGVRVWVLLQKVPEWRWGLEGDRCPWYPTMRLFRQSHVGAWGDVFQRVLYELNDLVLNKDLANR